MFQFFDVNILSLCFESMDLKTDGTQHSIHMIADYNIIRVYYRSDDGYFFRLDSPVLVTLFYMGQPP